MDAQTRHGIIIHTYHDLSATCQCGLWEMTGTTRDTDPKGIIYQRVYAEWAQHLSYRQARHVPQATAGA